MKFKRPKIAKVSHRHMLAEAGALTWLFGMWGVVDGTASL